MINKDVENVNESNLTAHYLIYLPTKESLKTVYTCSMKYLLVKMDINASIKGRARQARLLSSIKEENLGYNNSYCFYNI